MLIVFLITIICLSFTLIARVHLGSYKNHYTLFNVWWCSLTLLSYVNLSPLNKPSDSVYLIILIGSSSFNLSLFSSRNKLSDIKLASSSMNINVKLFILLQLLVTYFVFPYFLKGLAISQESSMAHLKAGLVDAFSKSQAEVIKIYWFAEPMIISSIFISCFVFYFDKKNLIIIGITLLNVILFSFAFGGRIQMFRMSIILVIFSFFKYFITGDSYLTAQRTKFSYILITCFILLMSFFTQERSWGPATDYFKMFNIYFIGSLSLLDHFIKHPNISQIDGDLLFGRATFASFIDPFILFGGKVLNIESLTTKVMGVNIINSVQEEFYTVGKGYSMNAFTTMYYPFIRDFGILGLIVFPFSMGLSMNIILYKLKQSKNMYYFIIYILFCYILIFASNRWEFVNFWPFGSLFYIYFLTSNKFARNNN